MNQLAILSLTLLLLRGSEAVTQIQSQPRPPGESMGNRSFLGMDVVMAFHWYGVLLSRPSVLEEIKLTVDQQEKLRKIDQELDQTVTSGLEEFRKQKKALPSNPDPKEQAALIEAHTAIHRNKIEN